MNHSTSKGTDVESSFGCDHCHLSFKETHSKIKHMKETHGMPKQTEKVECKLCDFVAKSDDILQKHMKVAMGHKIPKPCHFHMKGFCYKGRFCKFQHTEKTNFNNERAKYSYVRQEQIRSREQCKFRNNCFRFPNCGFTHYEICKYQMNCSKGNDCRFVHLPDQSFLGPPRYPPIYR